MDPVRNMSMNNIKKTAGNLVDKLSRLEERVTKGDDNFAHLAIVIDNAFKALAKKVNALEIIVNETVGKENALNIIKNHQQKLLDEGRAALESLVSKGGAVKSETVVAEEVKKPIILVIDEFNANNELLGLSNKQVFLNKFSDEIQTQLLGQSIGFKAVSKSGNYILVKDIYILDQDFIQKANEPKHDDVNEELSKE